MQCPKSAITKGLKLDSFYQIPIIYDKLLEISYPATIYKMKTVYGHKLTNTQVREETQETSSGSTGSPAATLANGSSGSIAEQLMAKQAQILTKLKTLRTDVDNLEKNLRKDKNPNTGNTPASVVSKSSASETSTSSSRPLGETLKALSGDKNGMEEAILSEEDNILNKLKALRLKLDEFGTTIGSDNTNVARVKRNLAPVTGKHELVIFANPKNPPLSLIAVASFLRDCGKVSVSTYTHSSVQSVPDHLKSMLPSSNTEPSRADADFLLSLIWKDVGVDPILMVNPQKQNPIFAEVNIIRYVLRILDPEYDSPKNLDDFAANNKWLQLASRTIIHGNAKERQSAVRQLNSHLGKHSFLLGKEAHLVDAAVFSALSQIGELKSVTGNVKTWVQGFHQSQLLSGMGQFLQL